MATYVIRVHHNETDDDPGGTTEYEISGNMNTESEIRMRLLEAQSISLANLAASAERIANALHALAVEAVH